MKLFVDWILARQYRLVLLAVASAPFVQCVTMALIALETLRRGVAQGALVAVLGTACVTALALAGGANVAVVAAITAVVFGAGLGLGALVRWTGSLTLAFQAVVLLTVAGVLVVSSFGPGGADLLAPVLELMLALLRERGATEQQIDAFRAAEPLVLGLLAAAVLTALLLALFLAYWWRGLAAGDSFFGREFRSLRLSRVLGLPASALVTAGLVIDWPLVQNLAALALFGFLFQGVSVMHAWAHARRWHAALVAPVYVLLVTPLSALIVLALSAVGLMDNWFDLRAPLRART
ncbi:MAG TPA: hypothetical protein VF329_04330 [Gammaproteobacteria bacterium]